MELVNQLIESSKFAGIMALSAFLLSIASFIWTRRSAKISKQALEESIKNNNRIKESEIEQKRYELLKAICEELSMLEGQFTLMTTLKADYESSTDIVQTLMGNRIKLFTETLPAVDKYKEDIERAHLEGANWNVMHGVSELLKLQAAQDVALVHTKNFIECNASLVTDFREQLLIAQQSSSAAIKANAKCKPQESECLIC